MNKLSLLVVGIWLVAVPGQVLGQSPDEVGRLRQEIELLKREVDVLKREYALIRKENDDLRKELLGLKAPVPKVEPGKSLSDLLIEGTVLTGTYLASSGRSGVCSLMIKERNDKKFKGVLYHKPKDNKGEGPDFEVEVQGTITTTGISYRRAGSPNPATFVGRKQGDYLEIDGTDSLGARAKASVKLPK